MGRILAVSPPVDEIQLTIRPKSSAKFRGPKAIQFPTGRILSSELSGGTTAFSSGFVSCGTHS